MATTLLTYSSMMNNIIAFFQGHQQVGSCYSGPMSELVFPRDSTSPIYPYVYILNTPVVSVFATPETSYFSADIDIIIMDQCPDGMTTLLAQQDEQDRQSAMMEIAKDFLSYYTTVDGSYSPYYIQTPLQINLRPFAEKYRDRVAGCEFTVNITVEQPLQRQYIPGYAGATSPGPIFPTT